MYGFEQVENATLTVAQVEDEVVTVSSETFARIRGPNGDLTARPCDFGSICLVRENDLGPNQTIYLSKAEAEALILVLDTFTFADDGDE